MPIGKDALDEQVIQDFFWVYCNLCPFPETEEEIHDPEHIS